VASVDHSVKVNLLIQLFRHLKHQSLADVPNHFTLLQLKLCNSVND